VAFATSKHVPRSSTKRNSTSPPLSTYVAPQRVRLHNCALCRNPTKYCHCTGTIQTAAGHSLVAYSPRRRSHRSNYRKTRGCRCCGKEHAIDKKACPAFGKQCSYRIVANQTISHLCACQNAVRLRQSSSTSLTKPTTTTTTKRYLPATRPTTSAFILVCMDVIGKRIRFLLDCGATVNLLYQPRYYVSSSVRNKGGSGGVRSPKV